jgi:hypothetical protein
MDETETDVLYDKNGEAGSFLTDHPFLCLTGTIFEDTEAGLHDVSRRVIKLFRFVGGTLEELYDDNRQSEGKADTGRNEKQADRADRNGAQGERERQWELCKLRHINLELYHQIGDLLRIKLQVLDAIERIKMAQLERSQENRLRASLKLAKREDDKSSVGEQLNNHAAKDNKRGKTLSERSTASTVDWVPDSD